MEQEKGGKSYRRTIKRRIEKDRNRRGGPCVVSFQIMATNDNKVESAV